MATSDEEIPTFIPKWILALLPALYGWQVYGWKIALLVFLLVLAALTAVGFAAVFRGWTFRSWHIVRTVIVIGAFLIIGVSATEVGHTGSLLWDATRFVYLAALA